MNDKLLEKIINEPSFYPEKKRKSEEQRRKDLLKWYDKYDEVNEYYNVWGLDCVDASPAEDWLDHGLFRKERYAINSGFVCAGDMFPTNYTVVMRDKSIFEMFAANVLGDTTKFVKSYALIKGYDYQSKEGSYVDRKNDTFQSFVERHNLEKIIVKRATGCSGKSVYVVFIKDGCLIHGATAYSPTEFLERICDKAATYLVQPFVKQHPFMSDLNPDTVNIVRIVTFNTGKRTFAVPSMLVYSRGDTEVCNSDQGSYYVGMSRDGVIEDKAIDQKGCRMVPCPVARKKLPFFEELKNLVCTLHNAIPELFTVGWDVALTENGPLVFEGNDGWCPYVSEWSPETALRRTWNEAVAERKEYFGF